MKIDPPTRKTTNRSLEAEAQSALTWLKRHSTKAVLDGMARYGVPSDNALGVSMKDMKVLGEKLGHNHELALKLWDTGVYEARMISAFVGDPARTTPAQMDRWCRDFDNWAIGDTLCFHLFDRTPFAWAKVARWSSKTRRIPKARRFCAALGLSRCTTGARATRRFSGAWSSSSAPRATSATS